MSSAIKTTIARNDGQSDAILVKKPREAIMVRALVIPRFLASVRMMFIACMWRASNSSDFCQFARSCVLVQREWEERPCSLS
jgi:hypothetical protein